MHQQKVTFATQVKRVLESKQKNQKKDVRKIEVAYLRAQQEMKDRSRNAKSNVCHVIHPCLPRREAEQCYFCFCISTSTLLVYSIQSVEKRFQTPAFTK